MIYTSDSPKPVLNKLISAFLKVLIISLHTNTSCNPHHCIEILWVYRIIIVCRSSHPSRTACTVFVVVSILPNPIEQALGTIDEHTLGCPAPDLMIAFLQCRTHRERNQGWSVDGWVGRLARHHGSERHSIEGWFFGGSASSSSSPFDLVLSPLGFEGTTRKVG